MKKILRAACLALAVLFVLSAVACTKKNDKNKDTVNTTAAESGSTETVLTADVEPINPELEKLDYGGAKVTFLTRTDAFSEKVEGFDEGGEQSWYSGEISVEELTNDPVNDAIYNRNLYVSELLNVEIQEVGGDISGRVRKDVSSGDGEYDIVGDSVFDGPALILDGLYYNLLDNGIETYLDISKPWWSQKWINEAMMGDRLYCITGSLALTLKRLMYVTYFNKTMAESNGIEDLYKVVEEGKWTIDYEAELVKKLYVDVNGNSNRDEEDSYGLLINHYECSDMYWSCFDMTLFAKDGDNWFYLNNDQEKLSIAVEKAYNLVYNNVGTYDFGGTAGFLSASRMFAQGQSLFASIHLRWAESEDLRNMQDTYGILPEPKYDEQQSNYYTYAHDQYSVFFVPITAKDTEMCGAVLEAMCYESYRTVDPAYFNLALKGRYANDQETRKMLDIVVDGLKIDASWIYGKAMGEPAAKILRGPISGNELSSFASNYAKFSRVLPYGLRELREKIEKFDY